MKRFFALSLFTLFVLSMFAQAPQAFQYQAVVSDNGVSLSERQVTVKFNIRENTADGTIVYSETHNATTNKYGLVSLQIGKGTALEGTFGAVNWSKGDFFIETQVDKGTGFIATGTQQLLSVPYAKFAENASKLEMTSASGKRFTVTIDEQGMLSTQEIKE